MEESWNNIRTVLGIKLHENSRERYNYFLINFLEENKVSFLIERINNNNFILIDFTIAFESYFKEFFSNKIWVSRFYEIYQNSKEILTKLYYFYNLLEYSYTVKDYYSIEVRKNHMKLTFSNKYSESFLNGKTIEISKVTPDMYNLCSDILLNDFRICYQRGFVKKFNPGLHRFIAMNL